MFLPTLLDHIIATIFSTGILGDGETGAGERSAGFGDGEMGLGDGETSSGDGETGAGDWEIGVEEVGTAAGAS